MKLTDRIAEAIAKRVNPEAIVKRIGLSVSDEISSQVGAISHTEIEEAVRAYLATGDFKNGLPDLVRSTVEELLQQYAPVLVLKHEEFETYRSGKTLEGPIATVNSYAAATYGHEAYNKALDILKIESRKMGGNVVELIRNEQKSRIISEGWFMIGNLYVNRQPVNGNQQTLPHPQ